MKKILHLVPGLGEAANGIAVAAKLIAARQGAELADCRQVGAYDLSQYDEVWVHSMWTPQVWKACRAALKAKVKLIRMTHGCLDPLRVAYHGWKKWLVTPIERRLFAKCDRVVVTGHWEEQWCRTWGVKGAFEIVDLKACFEGLKKGEKVKVRGEGEEREFEGWSVEGLKGKRPLRMLYLGRRHPLKGLDVLEQAIQGMWSGSPRPDADSTQTSEASVELREVSDHFGDELEQDWAWCDVLVLPTLSENYGLVVAEALERGKCVITTDGAPAWEGQDGVVYLKGYRDGTLEQRVELLKGAIGGLNGSCD